jgi:hypothetical protein
MTTIAVDHCGVIQALHFSGDLTPGMTHSCHAGKVYWAITPAKTAQVAGFCVSK